MVLRLLSVHYFSLLLLVGVVSSLDRLRIPVPQSICLSFPSVVPLSICLPFPNGVPQSENIPFPSGARLSGMSDVYFWERASREWLSTFGGMRVVSVDHFLNRDRSLVLRLKLVGRMFLNLGYRNSLVCPIPDPAHKFRQPDFRPCTIVDNHCSLHCFGECFRSSHLFHKTVYNNSRIAPIV